jgi:hypothetical protein
MSDSELCRWGQHADCEETRCSCTCHPRHGRRNNTDHVQTGGLGGARWHPGKDDVP